jgi:hypothetical protein
LRIFSSHYEDSEGIDKIGVDAVEEKTLRGEYPAADLISLNRNIPKIQSSDAYKLEDIGRYYTEIETR